MSFFSRQPIAPLEYTKRLWMRSWIVAVAFFLYAPLLVLIVFSFNDSKANVVWKGFTFKYYGKMFNNAGLMEALGNSLTIALLATIFSLILGALAAVLLWRFRFPFKPALEGTMALPIVVPEICMGVAMLVFFAWIKWPTTLPWPLSLSAITIAHITFSMTYVATIIQSRLSSMDMSVEEAAMDLGSKPWQVLKDITLPIISPAIMSGWLLAFTISLDDVVITSFTTGPGYTTL